MKRIDLRYGGVNYSIGGRELDDVLADIQSGVREGSMWLNVNDGDGMPRAALLLVTPGVDLAIIPIEDHASEDDEIDGTDD